MAYILCRILVPRNDPETLDYLCACESYLRPILLKDADRSTKEEMCHTIASVVGLRWSCVSAQVDMETFQFTPPQYRKLGYASKMMVLLHEALAQDSVLSILYSDVGDFYERTKREHPDLSKAKGWQVVDPYHVVLPVASEATSGAASASDFQLVEDTDFHRIAARDAALFKRELSMSKESPAFVILPEGDQIDWLIGRAKYHSRPEIDPSRSAFSPIANFGCEKPSDNDSDWCFAIWTFDFTTKQLDILRLRANTSEELVGIVDLARKAGAEQGMAKVTAWNVDPRLFPEGSGWHNEVREQHLPALAWYGEGEMPQWHHVEYYTWC